MIENYVVNFARIFRVIKNDTWY